MTLKLITFDCDGVMFDSRDVNRIYYNDLLAAFGKTIPLSRTMDEQLKQIRSWARTRALPATSQAKPEL